MLETTVIAAETASLGTLRFRAMLKNTESGITVGIAAGWCVAHVPQRNVPFLSGE